MYMHVTYMYMYVKRGNNDVTIMVVENSCGVLL